MVADNKYAVASFIIADKSQDRKIRKRAFDLMCYSFEEAPASELNRLDFHLLHDILMNNINFHVKQDMVFNRLVEWFRHDETEREKYMVELLKLIRLEFMPSEFLMNEQLEAIYRRFNCFESILGERKSRETLLIESPKNDRARSIFSVCRHSDDRKIYVEKYNSATNAFEDVGTLNVGARKSYGVQLHGNHVYVIGGDDDFGPIGTLKSVSRFDLTSGKEEILPEMHVPRASFVSILLGKYIYVFGGMSVKALDDLYDSSDPDESIDGLPIGTYGIITNKCERLDLETMTWTMLKPMKRARWDAEIIALNGYIYVVGGKGREVANFELEVHDTKNDEWHRLAGMDYLGSCQAFFKSNSDLYSRGFDGPLHRYDVSKNVWIQVESDKNFGFFQSSVETADGIFGITPYEYDFGKIHLNADGVWSFQVLTRPQHRHSWFSTNNLLFWN